MSFELRMRKRRLARCLSKADVALNEGRADEAREAIEEARQLDAFEPDIQSLEQRLVDLQKPAPAVARKRGLRPLIGIAAGLLVTASAGALGARQWYRSALDTGPVAAATSVAAPQPAPVPTSGSADVPQPINRLRVVHETILAPVVTPRIVADEPRLPAFPAPPIAEPEPQQQPEPIVHAVNRTEIPVPSTPEPRNDLRLEPNAPPPTPIDPPRAVVPPPDPVVLPAARASAAGPLVEEAATVRDESTAVRSVLRRYEVAYSSLDALAASDVWPAVNQVALARAFDGLASQRISLGSCDVTVSGPAASATCSGSATWEPKVGGGIRTHPRRWNFDLRKNGEAWRIERATAR